MPTKAFWISCGIIAAAIAAALYAVTFSPSYQDCEAVGSKQSSYAETAHTEHFVSVSPIRDNTFVDCESVFAKANGDAITAVSTLLLFFVTGILSWIAYRQYTTTRAQLRPYMFVSSCSIGDGVSRPNVVPVLTEGVPHATVWIKNFGQTPATKVVHSMRLEVCALGTEDVVCAVAANINTGGPETTIGPDAVTTVEYFYNRAISAYEVAGLNAVGHILVVFGRITYQDVFGAGHQTDYRLGYAGKWPPQQGVQLVFLPKGNGFR